MGKFLRIADFYVITLMWLSLFIISYTVYVLVVFLVILFSVTVDISNIFNRISTISM